MPDLAPTVAELATRPGHEKVRVLVHRMLVDGLGVASPDIDFEQPVPEVRGRIDALLGRSVLEFKSDLRREQDDAVEKLTRYLGDRERATGQRYVGLATDGTTFAAYERDGDGALKELARHITSAEDAHALLAWLQSVLAVGDEHAERVAAAVPLPADLHFVTARRRIRKALAKDGVAGAIDRLVDKLLG